MGHQAQHIALLVQDAGDVARPSHWGSRPRHSGRRRGPRLRDGPACRRRRNNCPRHGRPGRRTCWPCSYLRVKADWLSFTSRPTGRQTNLSPALRISAPGSMPVSVSTWKPLQMPSTAPPLSAWALTAGMMRDWRRHGTASEIVAIGEAAGQHDQIDIRQFAVLVPDHFGLVAGDTLPAPWPHRGRSSMPEKR